MGAGPVGRGDSYAGYRARLVETLQAKGIKDLLVLKAVSEAPRHLFVPESMRHRAYEDEAMPIGAGQTISQPWVQARMLELAQLTGKEKVLEIGAGSGYQTCLIALCADVVIGVERIAELAYGARDALRAARIPNASIVVGDGTLGRRAEGPYDVILVAAASPMIPEPLVDQLKPGGRLILPLGEREKQVITQVTKRADGATEVQQLTDVRFVPLIGKHGFGA
jgi:protein-L-isoaspartate(D-aspartate) O-methyltransferase